MATTWVKETTVHEARHLDRIFWGRWVAVNSLAEMLGLTASLSLGFGAAVWLEPRSGVVLAAIAVVLISMAIEGSTVGVGQWLVLRGRLPALPLRAWFIATAVGAGIAWTLGMIPSTIMSMGGAASSDAAAAGPELSDAAQIALGALMGLVLGPVLATPQWVVLRRHVGRAGWWIPANTAGWALGMPLVFVAISLAPFGGPLWAILLVVALGLAAAGAVVGAVHGAVLVWLLRGSRSAQ